MRGVSESIGESVFGTIGRVVSRTQEKRPLPVDLLESDEAYLAIFDAPGALSSDIDVRFEDGTIRVRLDRFRTPRDEFEMRFPGRGVSLHGSVSLPDDAAVDATAANATLKDNGTLHVQVPKVTHADGSTGETVDVADANGDSE